MQNASRDRSKFVSTWATSTQDPPLEGALYPCTVLLLDNGHNEHIRVHSISWFGQLSVKLAVYKFTIYVYIFSTFSFFVAFWPHFQLLLIQKPLSRITITICAINEALATLFEMLSNGSNHHYEQPEDSRLSSFIKSNTSYGDYKLSLSWETADDNL